MQNRSFPRWSALIIGPAIGAYVGLHQAVVGGIPFWVFIAGSSGIGFLAGLVIFLLEPGRQVSTLQKAPDPFDVADRFLRGQPIDTERLAPPDANKTLVGRLLAILSLVLVCCVGLNVCLAAVAVIVNWQTRGWPRGISVVSLVLALGITILFVIVLLLKGIAWVEAH